MSKNPSSYNVQVPSRRAVYRAAKRLLVREARRAWRGPVHAVARRVRAYLRGKSRSYLIRLLGRPAMALTVVTALTTGGPAYASGEVDLSLVSVGIGGFVINGVDEGDRLGTSLSGAGDVNGDGIPDIIISASRADPGNRDNAGQAYIVFGKASGMSVNLSDIASGNGGFVINGIDPYDRAGTSVSGIGDMNGDGLADVIVGAYRASPGGITDAGESYVVFGKPSTTAVELSDVAAGSGGFVVNGIDAHDRSGVSVSGAGDVNGDGIPDVIIGAFYADPDGNSAAGESYVVFGKPSTNAVDLSDVATGIGGFVINGTDQNDYSGIRVSGAGDVNGDGLADVIVGAPGPFLHSAGRSYVVFGTAATTPVDLSDVAAGVGGFVINGVGVLEWSGGSVSDAGDVNGDGLDDVIVGAQLASYFDGVHRAAAGKSYVVFGKFGAAAVELADVASGFGGFVINGSIADYASGLSVSGAGDVNGDGFADVIIGAPTFTVASPETDGGAGKSYIVFGKPDTAAVELADVAAGLGGSVLNGIDLGDRSGIRVSGIGDMNGDGFSDVIIGARQADPGGRTDAGESYVVFGAAKGPGIPGSGGGCFISTAAYGTPLASEIDTLRKLRDTHLLLSPFGAAFTDAYYRIGPTVSAIVVRNNWLRTTLRTTIDPIVRLADFSMIAALLLPIWVFAIVAAAGVGVRLVWRRLAHALPNYDQRINPQSQLYQGTENESR